MADEIKKPNPSNDCFVHPSTEEDITTIINMLRFANENSSTSSSFEKHMKECLKILNGYSNDTYSTLLSLLFSSESFNDIFDKIILHSIIPEFTKKGYFSYDESDFQGQSQITECVLEFLIKILSGLIMSNELSKQIADDTDREASIHVTSQKLLTHIPHLLLMVAGYANNPVWSSQKCQKLSLQLIHLVLELLNCTSVADMLSLTFTSSDLMKNVSLKHSDKSLLSHLLFYFEKPLSKDRWEKNPFLCESFLWIIMQLISPQLSFCLNQVMAVSLNLLHNYDASNKLRGIELLKHLIHSVSNEELRWYNRAEVIYEALKTLLYTKETLVLDAVIGCVFSVLKILEKPKDSRKRHHFILSTLLSNAESENLLVLRRIYISHLAHFFLDCGLLCIAHLKNILRVIENYLEVEDGPEELARMSALDALQNLLKVSWPRIAVHSTTVLKILLKFVININSPSFLQLKGENLKKIAEGKVVTCLNLLIKINPSVYESLQALFKADHKGYLKSFLNAIRNRL